MNNSKKLLALLIALAMLVSFAAPTFAAGEEQPVQADPNREYNIEFKFSDDIVNLKPEELKIINTYNWSSEGLTKAKAGTQLTIYPVDNSNFSWNSYYNYYYDGKKIEDRKFTMPDHDVVIYVTTKSHKAKNYVVSKATSQPTGWVKVTVNAGDHGGFIPQPRSKGDQPYKNETFYVNPLYEVEIIERNQAHFDVVFFDTDSGYKLKDTSKVKGIFTENTNKTLEYDKYLDYKVILHKYGTDETEVLTFAPTATYEEVVKVLRSKETSNPPQGQKFAGWLGEEEHGSRKIYALDKKYDEFNFFNAIYFNNPTYEGKLEDVDLYEVYTPNRIVYTGQKGWRNNLSLDYGEARTVEDGKKVSLYGNDYYEYNLNTKSFSSEKFDKETEIKKDYFLGMDTSGNSEEAKIEIIGEPQYDYKEMAEPKIDLSKMLVGINKYDAEGRGSTTYVHPRDFAAKGITLNYTDGQKLTGEDNGKYIKVTYTENGKEYFVYTNKSLEVIDDGFDKDNIKSIKVTRNPSTSYQVADSEQVKFYLDNLEVELKAANKDNTQADVTRKVSYKDFKDYGLKVKIVDGEDIDNNTLVKLEYNGKKLAVYWDKAGKDVDDAEIDTALEVVDKDAAKKAALKKAKEDAKDKIDKLENLTNDQKNEAKAKVEEAKDEAGVSAALKEAQDKDAEIKAKKEAEKALEEKKAELLRKIDEANLKDTKAVEALKKKVNDATVDTDLDELTKEIEDGIKTEQDKENFDERKTELKGEIEKSDLDAETKKNLTDKVDALEDPAGLNDIRQEFDAAKELKAAKDQAKKDIEALENLNDDEKKDAQAKVDQAKDKAGVDSAVEAAKAQDTKNKEEAEAKKALEEAKDAAKKDIDKLENLSPEEKKDAQDKVDQADNKEAVEKALEAAKTLDEENKKEAEAKKALEEAKDAAKKDIDKFENLSQEEKDAEKAKVDQADSKEAVEKVLEAAQAQDEENKKKKDAEEARAEADKAQEAADAEKVKAEEAEKKAADAEKAAEEAQTEADAKAKEAADAKTKETEAQKAYEDAKAKEEEAEKAAKENPNDAEAQKALEEAKKAADAAEDAQKEAKEAADTKEIEAKEAQNKADEAKKEADQAKADAKDAQDAADKAQDAADKAKADAEAKENALAPTAQEKDKAKKAIDALDNLSPEEKNEFKDAVDKAQTKGALEEALADAKEKDKENKNKPQPEPEKPGEDEPGEDPYQPSNPPYYPGYYYDEPSPNYLRDYSKKDEYKPSERNEDKKDEVKEEEKKDAFKTLYFYLEKYYYEMELNGNISQIPMDVAPTAINQRTMLPIRFVAEAIGATVEWHQDTQSATFTKDGITATITLGSNIIQVSDGRQIVMDAEPTVISERIFVPLTNISQIFGMTNGDLRDGVYNDIEWDQENYRVIITVRENQ